MTFLLVSVFLSARAQRPTAPRVYTYVEQMPQLPGRGGTGSVAMELLKRARIPAVNFNREEYSGKATVYLEISPTGTVQRVKLLRGTGAAGVDSALVTAAKSLPRFTPGRQYGQPVTVRLTVAFSCIKLQ